MLASSEIVDVVAEQARRGRLPNLVVDPVMVAKSGDKLLADEALRAVRERLVPLALVVTPNLPEAEVLVGTRSRTTGRCAPRPPRSSRWAPAGW